MNAIYQVVDQVKHNGTLIEAGKVFEGDTAEFTQLVQVGTLRILDGIKTVKEGVTYLAREEQAKTEGNSAPEGTNTWGPAPDGKDTWAPKDNTEVMETNVNDKPVDEVKVDPAAPADTVVVPAVGAGDLPPENGDNL